MSRLYAISLVSKSTLRDDKIGEVLGDDVSESPKWEFILKNCGYLTMCLTKYTKFYKTLSGADNFIKKLTKDVDGKKMRTDKVIIQRGSVATRCDIIFNSSEFKFIPIDVTDDWNTIIDSEIEKETERFEIKIQKLKEKKF